ncbi:arginase family protein [Aquamicrobium defluvii]|uniref:Arginase n=1 Tax=Aquamicrobium defluvii TaxID=69279 RepID=A0A011T4U0_9HYPH|nr:arginase family protein [Aquamicrobium defluvii]EXL06619.1 arginase [Aquamicrobium defluvii]EZQ14442.1 arginase [Halopseudomonas bauzanensis]TDR36756.1 arginase [Aquamicrobium defluvii]
MKLSVILAPYDSGHYQSGFGQGPDALVTGGLIEALTLAGHDVSVEDIGKVGGDQPREIATGFAVCRAVSAMVDAALEDGRFPVVLAGNCLTTIGAVAGERADSVIWFDQHGDINTPETSAHGFLDGMALATVLGLCWKPIAHTVPGFKTIDPARCLLVDARDLDEDERKLLDTLPVLRASCANAAEQAGKLQGMGAVRTHLHIDLDVIDPDLLQVNRYTTPGGPGPDELGRIVCAIARSMPVTGVTLSAYDPAFDPQGDVPPVAGHLLTDLLAALERI